jgi:hypothetical protein
MSMRAIATLYRLGCACMATTWMRTSPQLRQAWPGQWARGGVRSLTSWVERWGGCDCVCVQVPAQDHAGRGGVCTVLDITTSIPRTSSTLLQAVICRAKLVQMQAQHQQCLSSAPVAHAPQSLVFLVSSGAAPQVIKKQLAEGVSKRRVGFISAGAPARQHSAIITPDGQVGG